MQKKAQLVHWTDESDFQANSWLAGYDITYLWFPIYFSIMYVCNSQPSNASKRGQATAKLMIFFVLTGALVKRWYTPESRTVRRVRKGANPCAWDRPTQPRAGQTWPAPCRAVLGHS